MRATVLHRPRLPLDNEWTRRRRASPFHAIEQRPPESARPERGVDRVSSACVRPRAPWRRRCAPIACWVHTSERVHVTVSEAIGKRSWSAGHDPASASRGSGPGFALSSQHVDRPARSRKLAFPSRLFAAGSSSAPARRPTVSLPAERSRACRAGTPRWRLRRWLSSTRRSNRAGRGVRGVDRQGAFEARYVVAVVHASVSSRCRAPSGSLRSHRS